ncbi:rab-GTPase-TBC domain-containing protein [Daedaleopsis nitida]|nr:rab-GTPase-TBC domain-containing protein [Daedaleopsis nitida]
MAEGGAQGDVAAKTLTPLTTTIVTDATLLDGSKVATPTSPELPTVVATKPPRELGAAVQEGKQSEPLSSIPESTSDQTVIAEEETGSTTAEGSSTAKAEEVEAESFSTPEAKAESLPSPGLTTIPLSPADPPSSSSSTHPPATNAPSSFPAPVPAPERQSSSNTGPRSPRSPTKTRTILTPRPLSRTVASPTAAGLDSLLSPTESEAKFSSRQSVAGSDATDDETRFSTVLLSSAHQSLVPTPKISTAPTDSLHTVEEGLASDESTLVDDWKRHKKTASNSTILSANNVPYFMSQLGEAKVERQEEEYVDPETTVDWDFWGKVMNDYQGFASAHPEDLARAIERGSPRLCAESSAHEKSIMRDLGRYVHGIEPGSIPLTRYTYRTFPHHAFFTDGHGIGQENLFNVLKAYSLYDPQVGYCQGLPFVVAILLLNMPDEEAFCLLVRLMHSYDLRGHFLPDMPKLQLRLFERLLEEVLPVLHLHFVRQGIKASMYCSQWFLTMFSYRFPMDIVFRIYDNCLASGIEAMFAFSMALLSKNETTLLSMKFDQLIGFLNQRVFEVYQVGPVDPSTPPSEVRYRVDEFVQDAFSLRITPFMLDNYAHEYEELVRTRDAHKLEMENLRNTNQRLAMQVKNLENSLAQLNTEHCQVLNELVMARLRHEELESELVRYKLLYAEAMHQSEDAMSSHRISLVSKRGSSSTNN